MSRFDWPAQQFVRYCDRRAKTSVCSRFPRLAKTLNPKDAPVLGKMGKRKGGSKGVDASSFTRLNIDSGERTSKDRFGPAKSSFEEEIEEVLEERTESSFSDSAPPSAIVGSEKTSADYYFDSYSHFGEINRLLLSFVPFLIIFCWEIVVLFLSCSIMNTPFFLFTSLVGFALLLLSHFWID